MIRRPGRAVVIRLSVRDLANVSAVGTHDVDVGRAVTPACKRDQLAVRRPGGLDGEEQTLGIRRIAVPLRQPDLAAARGADPVDRIVAVTARGEEEVDPRRRRRAAACDREQQGQKYDNGADAGRREVLFVLDRLDAEIPALELRAGG